MGTDRGTDQRRYQETRAGTRRHSAAGQGAIGRVSLGRTQFWTNFPDTPSLTRADALGCDHACLIDRVIFLCMPDIANTAGTDYTAEVRCGPCGWQIAEPKPWLHDPAAQSLPCPRCGVRDAWIAEIGVADIFIMREFIGLEGKAPGRKKPAFELQAGDQIERSTGRWMRKYRLIDRDRDLYEEVVVDAESGDERHICRELLSEHWGHGSAKQKDGNLGRVQGVGTGG